MRKELKVKNKNMVQIARDKGNAHSAWSMAYGLTYKPKRHALCSMLYAFPPMLHALCAMLFAAGGKN
ncbi:MAG: hypothetical protein PHX78_06610 [bacterium]|nr:hypothetical protein [bacterium]